MIRNRKLIFCITLSLLVALFSGCASQVALLRGGTSRSFAIQGKDYDAAFARVVDTAKETGYNVVRQDKERGTFYLSRGIGYGEFTNMEVRVARGGEGDLRIDLVVTSDKSGDAIIGDFVKAYSKGVPLK